MKYVIGIDQSTQGTKALLLDGQGRIVARADKAHRQIIGSQGYISHDPEEIYSNTVEVVRKLLKENGLTAESVAGIGISNQRETTAAWNRETGKPVCDAVVWQCARGAEVCGDFTEDEKRQIANKTGIPLSPYFPASKMKWILKNCPEAGKLAGEGKLCLGTMDSWLLYRMTGGKVFKTDYSNASRTQLFNLHTLSWDQELCGMFGVPVEALPQVCDSDALFAETDMGGALDQSVPVHGVLGDSHGALFGQGCHEKGGVKATYGTGSSLMMNIGRNYQASSHGLVTSLAWGIGGEVAYVLEGNLNYTGAVITWLQENLGLTASPGETEKLALAAGKQDGVYLVPAFSGLGAPYWKSEARALICGMDRNTGRNEIVRAGLDCIAYQVTDVLKAMEQDSGTKLEKLCVDGGPTRNRYLMQFQSDMAQLRVLVPDAEELSGIGVAYLAGISLGVYEKEQIFGNLYYEEYRPSMAAEECTRRYKGWLEAVRRTV